MEVAGDRALRLGARAGAADLFRRSSDLTAADASVDLARRWRRVGEAIAGAGDLEEASIALDRAAARARAALDDPEESPGSAPATRRELALASAGLSRARYEQIRFAEALAIAEEALAVVGVDLPEAVPLRLARLRGIEGVSNDYATVHHESGAVLEAALATGDPMLAFDARRIRLGFATNLGLGAADEWVALAHEARDLGRWSEAVSGLSLASAIVGEHDQEAARPLLNEAEALAEARGLTEQLAWIGLARAANALEHGGWDAGVAAARAGLELSVRLRYDRAAVRTWFALTPMADARGDRATLERAAAWFVEHAASFPHSPYGVVQHAGVDLRLADAGLGALPALDDETLLAGLALEDDSPEWLAAVERIIEAALVVDGPDAARAMAERLPVVGPDGSRSLVHASRALVGSHVAESEAQVGRFAPSFGGTAAALARDALRHAREARAPWWISRAIRRLGKLGAASPAELDEASAIERELGIGRAVGH